MFEMERIASNKPVRIGLGMAASGLLLSACASSLKLQPGEHQPAQYRYDVQIGEADSQTVHLYTDTKPEITFDGKREVLTINGPTLCPTAGKGYVGSHQAYSEVRNNYCETGRDYYASYTVVPEQQVSVVDRGTTNTTS